MRLRGHSRSTRTMRFSVGAALRASAVERQLSSSAPCHPFFSSCTAGLRLGAMAVLGHERDFRLPWQLHPPGWYSTSVPHAGFAFGERPPPPPPSIPQSKPQIKASSLAPEMPLCLVAGARPGPCPVCPLRSGRSGSLPSLVVLVVRVVQKVKGEASLPLMGPSALQSTLWPLPAPPTSQLPRTWHGCWAESPQL